MKIKHLIAAGALLFASGAQAGTFAEFKEAVMESFGKEAPYCSVLRVDTGEADASVVLALVGCTTRQIRCAVMVDLEDETARVVDCEPNPEFVPEAPKTQVKE